MFSRYFLFRNEDRFIEAVLTGQAPVGAEIPPGFSWIGVGPSEEPDTHYISDDLQGVFPRRSLDVYHPSAIVADGEAQAEIQVSEYAGVFVTGPTGVRLEMIDDGVVFSTLEPGAYVFRFDGPEILTKEIVINAT